MRIVDPQGPARTYADVLDTLPIVAYIARPDGTIAYVSLGWEMLTGTSRRDLLEQTVRSVIHPDDRERAIATWSRARAEGEPYDDELRVRLDDGSHRWMLSKANPLRENGTVIGWFGTLTDIDDRKRTEDALAQSESTYRAFSAAIPGVTWAASPAGDLTYVGDAWTEIHGKPREGALGESWLEAVHPDDRERVLARWAQSLGSGEIYDIQFRLRVRSGAYRWFLVRALPIADDLGRIVRWVGVNVDIDEQRRADESREQFVRLIENSDDFIGIADRHGNVSYVNEAGRRMLEIPPGERNDATNFIDYVMPQDRPRAFSQRLPLDARDGRWTGELRLRNFRTGEPIPISYNVFSLVDETGALSGFATVSRDLRARYRVEAGLRVLAKTGAIMFKSLDIEATLRNIAEAVTEQFATYCIIDLLGDDGDVRKIASVHSDSNLSQVLDRAVAARIVRDGHHVARALRDGETTFVAEIRAEFTTRIMLAESQDDVRTLAPRSLICVPLRADPSAPALGALTFVVDARDLRGGYTQDDVEFAKEVAVRAGLAVTHARTYERERRIAVTLQEAWLPKTLPELGAIRLRADYRPGSTEATIGGDWYDAFTLDDGRVVFTIGDVMGNGLSAAVTMGKLRQAMQSVAFVLADPRSMLAAADRTVRAISSDTYATAIAGIYDPQRHELTYACAGHPPALLRGPNGVIEDLRARGSLLGLGSSHEMDTAAIAPGSTLVLFTDGLIEATRDTDEGLDRVRAALHDPKFGAAQNPAKALIDCVLRGEPASDDIAVLVAEISD
jgi:PAS domain S-box-containing protein